MLEGGTRGDAVKSLHGPDGTCSMFIATCRLRPSRGLAEVEGELYDQGDLRAIIDAHREEHSTEEDQRPAGAEVDILCVCAWSKGFAVGGTRGYLGVFQLDARAVVDVKNTSK